MRTVSGNGNGNGNGGTGTVNDGGSNVGGIGADQGHGGAGGSGLARTGSNTVPQVVIGLTLVLLGGALVIVRRRRFGQA